MQNLKPIILVIIVLLGLAAFLVKSPLLITIKSAPVEPGLTLTNYRHLPIPSIASQPLPELTTPYYLVIDRNTENILAGNKIDERIYPASITKLATALTALNTYSLDETVIVEQSYGEGKVVGLVPGQKFTVRSLVEALLVYSANDTAYALALHHPKGLTGFIEEMNSVAKKYRLNGTHFTNVDGIHHPSHYSTLADLARLGRVAIDLPTIRDTIRKQTVTLTTLDGSQSWSLASTNELLGKDPSVEGIKTGYTVEAGGCFISLIKQNDHYLITVVAQSQDRFTDTQKLIDWSRSSITWNPY